MVDKIAQNGSTIKRDPTKGLKRVGIKRGGRLNKTSQRQRALDREAEAARDAFASQFPRCWICGSTQDVDTHEMVCGSDRQKGVKHRCTWLRLCQWKCHLKVQSDYTRWPIAAQLALKRIRDESFYDRAKVCELRGRADTAVTTDEVLEWYEVVMQRIREGAA